MFGWTLIDNLTEVGIRKFLEREKVCPLVLRPIQDGLSNSTTTTFE